MPEEPKLNVNIRSPGLDRGFTLSGALRGRLYLRPTGLLAGRAARAACEAGLALPLAGGPLAFTLCEVLHRKPGSIEATIIPVSDPRLDRGLAQEGGAVGAYVAETIDRLSSPRPPFAGLSLDRPRLMGILNVTPDSFSDGGDHMEPVAAIAHGRELEAAGADIVDMGGESTRPGAEPIDVEEELRRVRPVLDGLKNSGMVLSIDTRRAKVMAAALDAGVRIINDVTALAGDPESLPLAAARRASVVLMHMQGEPKTMQQDPRYDSAPLDVFDALSARVEACLAAGIPRARIAVDPGLGFGKTAEHNLEILECLSLFHGLGVALMLGASRKRFTSASSGPTPSKERLGGSLAAALGALDQGAQLLRIHDVRETRQMVTIWRRMHGDYGDY